MSPEQRPDAALNDLAEALGALTPRQPIINREELMFRAGRAAGRGSILWPAATGISTLTALCLAGLLWTRPGPMVVERIVRVPGPAEAVLPSEVAAGPDTIPPLPSGKARLYYYQVQDQVLSRGLDGLPPATVPSTPAPESADSFLPSTH